MRSNKQCRQGYKNGNFKFTGCIYTGEICHCLVSSSLEQFKSFTERNMFQKTTGWFGIDAPKKCLVKLAPEIAGVCHPG